MRRHDEKVVLVLFDSFNRRPLGAYVDTRMVALRLERMRANDAPPEALKRLELQG
jgi:hypothetical protein